MHQRVQALLSSPVPSILCWACAGGVTMPIVSLLLDRPLIPETVWARPWGPGPLYYPMTILVSGLMGAFVGGATGITRLLVRERRSKKAALRAVWFWTALVAYTGVGLLSSVYNLDARLDNYGGALLSLPPMLWAMSLVAWSVKAYRTFHTGTTVAQDK